MKNLSGKNAVVTGAAKGIGLGIAERFAQEGVNVLLADIMGTEAETEAVRLSSEYGIKAEAYQIDLTSKFITRRGLCIMFPKRQPPEWPEHLE